MRIGYVSDERYLALPDALVALERGDACVGMVRASPRGEVFVNRDLPPGAYGVTLAHPGYGSKSVTIRIPEDLPYHFRLLSDGLLGYAWPKWVRSGEEAEFRVHAPAPYKLDLWRYGAEKIHVRPLGWYDDHGPRTTIQLLPDGDFSQAGVQWNRQGYGSRWHQQRVAAPERSGLYYFHASMADGVQFGFPWLVSPARPTAPVAVLASILTWNAYNSYGGRSNYVNSAGLPPTPVVHARSELQRYLEPGVWPYEERAAPLSFDRPDPFHHVPFDAALEDPIEGRLEQAMAPGLWRLLGWMEREAFPYDLYADPMLHDGTLDLDAYRVLVLDNHPEYWSPEMYRRVKAWVYERGGKLLYLGGCGLLAEVEFAADGAQLCRREWRADLRGEPAAQLLGVEYTHSGYQSGAPYRVLDAAHWVFEGTGLREGDLFGLESQHMRCPGGASGHELDKLSADTPRGAQHLAKGMNPDESGADMVMYETASGGAVFAPGSLCWPLSLLVDKGVSQVTANVLRHFLG